MLKKLRIIIVLAILISGLGYHYYTCEHTVQLPGEDAFSLGLVVADQSEGGGYGGPQGLPGNQGQQDYSIPLSACLRSWWTASRWETTGDAAHTWELAQGQSD